MSHLHLNAFWALVATALLLPVPASAPSSVSGALLTAFHALSMHMPRQCSPLTAKQALGSPVACQPKPCMIPLIAPQRVLHASMRLLCSRDPRVSCAHERYCSHAVVQLNACIKLHDWRR